MLRCGVLCCAVLWCGVVWCVVACCVCVCAGVFMIVCVRASVFMIVCVCVCVRERELVKNRSSEAYSVITRGKLWPGEAHLCQCEPQ